MRAVGYRQAWSYLDGELDAAGLRFKGTVATRQLAKRQLTWQRQFHEQWPELSLHEHAETGLAQTLHAAIERELG